MSWQIGNLTIKNQLVLAPMAGISDPSFMQILADFDCGLVFTELISAEAIVRNNKKTLAMLKGIDKVKIPVGVQIFGSNPDTLAKAASIIEKSYPISLIDINMGCPVPKVALKGAAGSALLKNPKKIGEIVAKVVAAVSVPVTIKIRSGWDESSINAPEVAKIAEANGACAISIHARTRAQGYSGLSDWSIIKKVKESVSIPVIGNGDVTSPLLAAKMLADTGCDAVMIGRAAFGNPWIFKMCSEYLTNGVLIEPPTNIEKLEMIRKHFNLLKEDKSSKVALLEIRSHSLSYLKGIPESKAYKERICNAKTEKEFLSILTDYEEFLTNN